MLDPRVYRAGFVPALLALVVVAFSLVERPRPLQTTLAPDAFDETRAFATLQSLAGAFPDRRPGGEADARLASVLARDMRRAGFSVEVRREGGRTIDGTRDLTAVVGTRTGPPGPAIVVVAHRDAAGRPAEAELSGTAALDELTRVFAGRRTRRTIVLASTSGGSGGAAGAAAVARDLRDRGTAVDAVLVLGDLASTHLRKPWVLPWSDGRRLAPIRLRRTAEAAVKSETGQEPGGARALVQFVRLAFPFAAGEEGRFNEAGLPAVTLSASGERGPSAGAPVSIDRLRVFGRAALRTIDALDKGRTLPEGPTADVVTQGKVLPGWTVRLLVGLLLAPALLAAVDGLARARRRREPVAVWLRWLLALAVPFALVVAAIRLMGLTGLLGPAPGAAVVGGRVPADGVALAVVVLVLVLGAVLARPVAAVLGAGREPEGPGPAAALGIATAGLALLVWLRNPFAAAFLVLPAHLWLVVPALRLRPGRAILLALAALAPLLVALSVYASALGLGIAGLPWSLVLLVGGGHVGVLGLLGLCAGAACAVAAVRLASRSAPEAPAPSAASVLGPRGHAGPGALGGTDSALRIRR